MNQLKSIFLPVHRNLVILGLVWAAMLALYFITFYFKNQVQTQLSQVQQAETVLQAALITKQDDLANLQSKSSRFNQLRQQGLLGDVDRQAWVDQLIASKQRLGLEAVGLTYTLHTAQALAGSNTNAAATALPGQEPLVHILEFELSHSHEEDLLALLHDYRSHVKGFFRVDACSLSSRAVDGLTSHCWLRFFNLPDYKANVTSP